MSHRKLIKTLKFYPLSDTFGQTDAELNPTLISKPKCLKLVCELIAHAHDSGLSVIDE